MIRNDRKKVLSRKALEVTEGLFAHTFDIALWSLVYFGAMSMPQKSSGQIWRAQVAADQLLGKINYDVLKNALISAKRRGFIKKSRRHTWPEITREGKKRLTSVIPQYDSKRVWDEKLYLVTYDIPEPRRNDREELRLHLVKIGCAKLQESVWLTPYDPNETLRSFIEENGLQGTIIISDMGKDGSIGDEDVHELIVRIYNLEMLNDKYEDWLNEVKERGIGHWTVISYLSVLCDDPQLPFTLLPKWWKGDIAYSKVKSHLQKVTICLRPSEK